MQRLVFLDETGLNTKMTRLYGRSPVGERCQARAPFGHWQTATFIAALRHDRLCAPWLLDGPMDGTLFLTYVEQVLYPELQRGDLVICDNLSSHKVQGVREAIAAAGARLRYLPAYSPDLNPIEMAFAKLKAHLRRAAARDWESLLQATAQALPTFTAAHCRNTSAQRPLCDRLNRTCSSLRRDVHHRSGTARGWRLGHGGGVGRYKSWQP